jgi:phospholipase/carboxylesterase
MNTQLSTVEILPSATHRYSIIWLHGLGADGHDFESIVPQLKLKAQPHIHFIFPNAPIQAVTINGGMMMRSWYDILEMSLVRKVDIDGIYQSAAAIESLIAQEIAKGIAAEHILLAGFSQGGLIALHTGLRYEQKLAGIVALSTYLPTAKALETEGSAANKTLPIFMAHGTMDSIVAIQSGKIAATALTNLGYALKWCQYPMDHSVCLEEISDIADFIDGIFNET